MARILLVDDDAGVLDLVCTVLAAHGYDVIATNDALHARDMINSEAHFDLMLSDIDMSPLNGIALLRQVCIERPEMPVVMFTGNASLETATEAMKLGAYDYILKPLDPDEFMATIARALKHGKAFKEKTDLKIKLGKKYFLENIIAESDEMRSVCEAVKRLAPLDIPVCICGGSGTGKTLVAQTIHSQSPRKDKPFLAIDCASLPIPLLELVLFGHEEGAPLTAGAPGRPGMFEAVQGGTVVLEELDAIPLEIQEMLVVMVKTGKVQRVGSEDMTQVAARLLVTSNIPLADLRNDGTLDERFHAILRPVTVEIKQIRERPQDIIPLAYQILRAETTAAAKDTLPTLSDEVQEMLESYSWPGNVAELTNAIKHAISCATQNKITKEFLPAEITASFSPKPRKDGAVDEEKGKSLKAFIETKRAEYLDKLRPASSKPAAAAPAATPKTGRFGTKIRIKPPSDDLSAEGDKKWIG